MSLIEWDRSYALELEEIDEHHKHLVTLLNSLYDGIVFNTNTDVGNVFDELVAYVKYHFSAEEKLMRDNMYRGYRSHVDKHNEFVKSILDLQDKYHAGAAHVSTDTMLYLKDWLFDHILKADKKYVACINKCTRRFPTNFS
jgi:hemerythrin